MSDDDDWIEKKERIEFGMGRGGGRGKRNAPTVFYAEAVDGVRKDGLCAIVVQMELAWFGTSTGDK